MSHTCNKCSRINPSDAVYCYYDGALLQGHSANGGPVNPGVMPFPNPFVFPTGQSCQNFDQLAMACQQSWSEAVGLLRKGFLGGFFGGLGRADLAMAAQEAAAFPDQDRGLDQLLSKLPSKILEQPKLKVEPLDVNLGTATMGVDRQFELHLSNQGMRLLYGSIASDSKWMTIGDPPGQNQKLFQFRDETTIPVQIRGKELRAGNKPLEGHLFLDSNGGNQVTVTVQLQVPIKPFQEGVLAGATTPRQIAEKAKASPKEAAVLFENGAVANWFASNGWIYPVQGPSASGLGAVQQFFEALGLARPPKVTIDKQSIMLQGAVGQSLQTTIEVKTQEKRPVYAHATANEPWVDVSQIKLSGRVALIYVRIPNVPYDPGRPLTAKIRVAANGNQRFEVPLTVAVSGGRGAPPQWDQRGAPVVSAEPVMAIPADEPVMAIPAAPADNTRSRKKTPPPDIHASPSFPQPAAAQPAFTATPAAGDSPFSAFAVGSGPITPTAGAGQQYFRPTSRPRHATPMWVHALPMILLLIALLVTVVKDLTLEERKQVDTGLPIEPHQHIKVYFDYPFFPNQETVGESLRFGIVKILDPGQEASPEKKLTFHSEGISNSTVVRIDGGRAIQFSNQTDGRWARKSPSVYGKWGGAKGVWIHSGSKVQITQIVEKVPGTPFSVDGQLKRAVDTCYVRYEMYNKDNVDHSVGIRFVLDTKIGHNDGVPFTISGRDELVDEFMEFPTPEQVPVLIQALEKPDLNDPGVVVELTLKNPGLANPDRVLLTRWPGLNEKGMFVDEGLHEWDVSLGSFHTRNPDSGKFYSDSSVVIYWNEKPLAPGEKRTVGFKYGLAHLVKGTGSLGATMTGDFALKKKITITGYVTNPKEGETLTLDLPSGLKLIEGSQETQQVPQQKAALSSRPSPVTWYIQPVQTGEYTITINSSEGHSVDLPLSIASKSIFGGS